MFHDYSRTFLQPQWLRYNLKFVFILMLILVLPFLWIWRDGGIILTICENMMILINMGRETLPWLSFPKLMCDVFNVFYDSIMIHSISVILSFYYLGSDKKGNHKKLWQRETKLLMAIQALWWIWQWTSKWGKAIDKEPAEQKSEEKYRESIAIELNCGGRMT